METQLKTKIKKYHGAKAWYLLPSPFVQVDKIGKVLAIRVGISWFRGAFEIQFIRGPFDDIRSALKDAISYGSDV